MGAVVDNWFLAVRVTVLGGLIAWFMFRSRHQVHWPWVGREMGITIICLLLYWQVRGLTAGAEAEAIDNAHRLVDLERALYLYREGWVQDLILDRGWSVTFANWVYIWGHWPFIAVVAAWLVLNHPEQYHVTRNAFLVSGAVGLIVFAVFPVAPPRLVPDLGLIDTVEEHSHAYRVLQPPSLVNQFAAMPSLHFGWNLLVGIAMIRSSRSARIRAVGVLSPTLMFFGIVATANHFIIDAIVGGSLCLVSLGLMEFWERKKPGWGHRFDRLVLPHHPRRTASRGPSRR